MKKLFTLVVAAFAVLTVSAKEDIDISGIATDGVVTFSGNWQWKGINYGTTEGETDVYADKSDFDYVVVEYTAGTCGDVNLIAQYEKDGTTGAYGANYYSSSSKCSVNPAGGILAVAMDEHKNKLNAVALQNCNTSGTLTIKAAYFATTAEYEAAKAEADKIEKTLALEENATHSLAAKAWGWDSKWLDKDVSDFNTLVVEVASVDGHSKMALQGTAGDGSASFDLDLPASTEPATYTVDISTWTKLSQYAYQNLNKPDGDGYGESDIAETKIVVTKVYLTSKTKDEVTGISNTVLAPLSSANAAIYNLAGQKVDSSYKGVVIQNGKKFVQK